MTSGANIYRYFLQGRAGGKGVSANADCFTIVIVFRVNIFFHTTNIVLYQVGLLLDNRCLFRF